MANKCLTVANPDITTYPGSHYYELGVVEYAEQMHSDLPKPTTLRGYVQLNDPKNPVLKNADGSWNVADAVKKAHYLGHAIATVKGNPVRIKYTNLLPAGTATVDPVTGKVTARNGDFFLPVDHTIAGAGLGPDGVNSYTENRATLHLHGGDSPWISDGTPHQWIAPAADEIARKGTGTDRGASVRNIPDMPDPGPGSATMYYPNDSSARFQILHDHVQGLTRMNAYSGEATGYMVVDAAELEMFGPAALTGVLKLGIGNIINTPSPAHALGTILVLQDKTFVPPDINVQDAKWDTAAWGKPGDLWFPHVYEDILGPGGRWDLASTALGAVFTPQDLNFPTGGYKDPSTTPEAFMDTAVVNGTAYPTLTVDPTVQRFRLLSVGNDRWLNLSLFVADSTQVSSDGRTNTEVKMVAFDGTVPTPAHYGTPNPLLRPEGVPDPATAGPDIIQIGTEAGFLPKSVAHKAGISNFDTIDPAANPLYNIKQHAMMIGPGERADVLIDFSQYAGKTLILYNDAPAPQPGADSRYDYFTGDGDQTASGGAASTLPGFGPNTRTYMQIKVNPAPAGTTPVAFDPSPAGVDLDGKLAKVWANNHTAPLLASNLAITKNADGTETATVTDVNGAITGTKGSAVTRTVQVKAIEESFETSHGRLTAMIGVAKPAGSALSRSTYPLSYVDPVTEKIADGETQIWKITHNGVDGHPMHWHLVNLQILARVNWQGVSLPLDGEDMGWKETIRVNPMQDLYVAVKAAKPRTPFGVPTSSRYRDPAMPANSVLGFSEVNQDIVVGLGDPAFGKPFNYNPLSGNFTQMFNTIDSFDWEYVWHCHILGHEEYDLMRPLVLTVKDLVPSAPTLAAPAFNAANGIALNWTDPTPATPNGYLLGLPGVAQGYANAANPQNEIGFTVERQLVGAPATTWTPVGTAISNATALVDAAPADLLSVPGAAYNYRVAAWNTVGSTPSAVVTVNGVVPVAPTGLATAFTAKTTTTPASIKLSWVDAANNEAGYVVERATVTSSVATGLATTGTYAVLANGNLPANSTSLTDSTVAANTAYSYRVHAFGSLNGTTYNGPSVATYALAGKLAVPLVLGGLPTSTTAITLGWIDPLQKANITVYELQRCVGTTAVCTVTSTNWVTAASVKTKTGILSAESFADTGLTTKTSYTYRVRSVDDGTGIVSVWSNVITVKTK
jgi:FtsP/CotA-like multicopper oxidase with cupredoxin domain